MKNLSLAFAFTMMATAVFAQNKSTEPVMWELRQSETEEAYKARLSKSTLWTQKLYEIMRDSDENITLHKTVPADYDVYCPRYKVLDETQRMNFWAQLIAAVSYKESTGRHPVTKEWTYWEPTSRMREPSFKHPDIITKQPVHSEGLMQLSYQDVVSYKNKFDCTFDWQKDKEYKPNDSRKTIFAPYRNLRCGLLILNNHVKNNGRITTKGVYWSVLRPKAVNPYSQTMWIAKQTQSLSFCGKTKLVQNYVAPKAVKKKPKK